MEKRPKIGDYITGVESLSDDPIDHKKWSVALNKYIDDLESRLAEEKERAKFIRNQNIDLVQACEELRKRLKEAEAKVEGYERVFKILRNHKDLPPEFATVINENFWELI